jgi:hypothetical protein
MQSSEILSGAGLTPAAGSATAAAGAMTATLASAAGRTAWITGFDITGAGATGASVVLATITGLAAQAGSTLNYDLPVVAGATLGLANNGLAVRFDKPLPASAQNTNILLSVPSFGTGNTLAACNIYGYLSNP